MAKGIKKFTKRINQRFAQKQNEMERLPAVMGDGAGGLLVDNQSDFIYCQIGGKIAAVYNNRVANQIGLAVWVGRTPEEPNLFQVLSTRSATPAGVDGSYVGGYAPAKRYEWHAQGGGQDPLAVHLRAISPLRLGVSATANTASTLYADLYRGSIYTGTEFKQIARQNINLFSHIPSTANKAALVLITIDNTGAVIQTKGSEVDIDALTIADVPAIPANTVFVCGAIRVYNGQTAIQDGRTNTDFWDGRFIWQASNSTAPIAQYTNTKANIEALTGITEGAIAYATDTDQLGTYNGASWDWRLTQTQATDLTDGGNTTLHTHSIYGVTSGTLAQFAATTSAQLAGVLSDETGSGAAVFATSPTLVTPLLGTPTSGVMTNVTGLPLTTGVTGILPAANGGTGINNSTRTLTISTNAGTISFSAAASTLTVPATGTAALLATANVFTANQTIGGASNPALIISEGNDYPNNFLQIRDVSATQVDINKQTASGVSIIDINPIPSDGTSTASFRFFRATNTTGRAAFDVYNANTTTPLINCSFAGNGNSYVQLQSGNFGIGTNTYGASADSVLALLNGTEPTTSPADTLQIFAVDLSAGNSTLGIRTETAVATETVTSDRTLSVKINGTTYKICLKA